MLFYAKVITFLVLPMLLEDVDRIPSLNNDGLLGSFLGIKDLSFELLL